MISGIPSPTGSNIQRTIFYANSATPGVGFQTYNIPPNASMLSIFLLGGGGGGGLGGTGTAGAGGGAAGAGGGSSGQTIVTVPASLLPPVLFLSIGYGGAPNTAGIASRISVYPDTTANHCLALANPGQGGGNGTTAVGIAGAGGGAATIANMILATLGFSNLLAGQAGINGGSTALTLPTTGLVVTGGTGGGNLTAPGNAGAAGGSFTVPAGNFIFPPQPGGTGPTNGTTPAGNGSNGINFIKGLNYFYGGAGSSSTHGSATGAGLVKADGGNGGYGCGGGGTGGGLTGSVQSTPGRGGDGLAIIYAW